MNEKEESALKDDIVRLKWNDHPATKELYNLLDVEQKIAQKSAFNSALLGNEKECALHTVRAHNLKKTLTLIKDGNYA